MTRNRLILLLFAVFNFCTAVKVKGQSWIPAGPAPLSFNGQNVSGRVWATAISPAHVKGGIPKPSTIFIGTDGGGLWRSKNFDGNPFPLWEPVLDNFFPATQRIFCITVSPNDPELIFAGSENGLLLQSTDGGDSWSKINIPVTDNRSSLVNILINPVNADVYLALGFNEGFFRSSPTGFIKINNGFPATKTFVTSFDFTVTSGGDVNLFASSRYGATPDVNGIWSYNNTTAPGAR